MFLFVGKYDIPSIHRLVPAGESETGCWHCLIPAPMSFFYFFLSTAARNVQILHIEALKRCLEK